ncbi:MAG: hypothetical protein M5R40_24825 [Anaerolineae bacterium]|nr:hypothetical protein [Anaerolineae bacterium]
MEILETLLSLSGVLTPIAIAVTLVVLGLLSQRLGAVTNTPPFYRWFYGAAGLVSVAALFGMLHVLSTRLPGIGLLYQEAFYLLTFSAPIALGLTVSAIVAWRYWGWLLSERG